MQPSRVFESLFSRVDAFFLNNNTPTHVQIQTVSNIDLSVDSSDSQLAFTLQFMEHLHGNNLDGLMNANKL